MSVLTLCGGPHCGELVERVAGRSSFCDACRPTPQRTPTKREHHSYAWQKLSRRARARQRFCLDCGTDEDLSADHLPQSYLKLALGQRLDLSDVEVVCKPCNTSRGSSEIGTPRFMQWLYSPLFLQWVCQDKRRFGAVVELLASEVPSFTPPRWSAGDGSGPRRRGGFPSPLGVLGGGVLPKPVAPLPLDGLRGSS